MGLLTVLARRRAASGGGGGYTPPASAQHYWSAHLLSESDGQTPSLIPDQVGSADITPTNGSSDCTVLTIGGAKWLRRNAVNTLIRATIASIPQPWTLLMTWRYPTGPTSSHTYFEGNAAFSTPRVQYVATTPRSDINLGNGTRGLNGSLNTTDGLALVLVANGLSSSAHIRGGLAADLDPVGVNTNSATGTIVAWGMAQSGGLDSTLGELLICNTALSLAEINAWGQQAKVSWTDIT